RLALSELFWCASNLCDLDLAAHLQDELEKAYQREGRDADIRENAFRALMWSGDEDYLLRCAQRTAQALLPPVAVSRPPLRRRETDEPIRIGYMSSDFCDHATMSLFAG